MARNNTIYILENSCLSMTKWAIIFSLAEIYFSVRVTIKLVWDKIWLSKLIIKTKLKSYLDLDFSIMLPCVWYYASLILGLRKMWKIRNKWMKKLCVFNSLGISYLKTPTKLKKSKLSNKFSRKNMLSG